MAGPLALSSALQILADYEEARALMAYGLWLAPDTVDLRMWHGLLAVREGRYAGGVFRFLLAAHPRYPCEGARPLVVFLERPYHPLVCPVSGALQVEARFPAWRGPGGARAADRLPLVVELVREVLTSDLVLVPPAAAGSRAYNGEAARLARSAPDDFDARARASARRRPTSHGVRSSSGVRSLIAASSPARS